MIQRAFPQAEIQDDGGEQNYRFQILDERNGYARVVGPYEGYQDFFLIRGKRLDRLISVEYWCGPACGQRMTVYRFDSGGVPTPIPLMDVLDLSRSAPIRRKLLNLCLDSEGNFTTQADARAEAHRKMTPCPFVFSFPKKGSSAVLFKVIDENGSDMLLSVGKTQISPQLLLRWNGAQFAGAEPDDAGLIFLNDEKMRALF